MMAITEASNNSIPNDSGNQLVQSSNDIEPKPLDFDECLKDSPKFRQNLKENLNYVENLETCMTHTIKKVINYIDTGKDHLKSHHELITSLKSLNATLGPKKDETPKRINALLGSLDEIVRLHEIVIDQSMRTIGVNLTKFINDDLMKIREARKSFDKISHEYDQAITKHSQPVKKQQDDSENLLIATSTAFTHTSLDLSIQLTALHSKKGVEILSSLLSFIKAHNTFFHQGSDLFEDLKPHISDMDEYLTKTQDSHESLIRNLPSKHLMVSNNTLKPLCFDTKAQQVHLEGYLFKRASNGFKVWNRRWFILKDHRLLYQKRGDMHPSVMEDDLRLLTVRPVDRAADTDRRFCFEILSPHKSHTLQADSEASSKTWISAIQAGINAAFHDTDFNDAETTHHSSKQSNSGPGDGAGSWSGGFSLKALQQQATSRINSITGSLDPQTKSDSKGGKGRDGLRQSSNESNDEHYSLRIDERGRSYAALRPNDDHELDDDRIGDNLGFTTTPTGDKTTDFVRHLNNHTGLASGTTNNISSNTSRFVPTYPQPAAQEGGGPAGAHFPPSSAPVGAPSCEAPLKPQRAYMKILAMPGNDTCADCGAQQPMWASINLGITLCIECAGIHRSLGVHLSKVRSLTLDTEVWSAEVVRLMLTLGNTSVNAAYMASYRNQVTPIDSESGREERENWIKSKYLLKRFMRPPEDGESQSSGATSGAGATASCVSEKRTVVLSPDPDPERKVCGGGGGDGDSADCPK